VRIDVECGEVEEILYPEGYYLWREKVESSDFQCGLDVNGEANLKWLLLLCQYPEIHPKSMKSIPKPMSVIEADKLCSEQLLQFFLSGFKASSWESAPFTKEEILKIVDRFLLLLQTRAPFNFPGNARTQKMNQADNYVYKILLPHIESMNIREREAFTNRDAYEFVQKSKPQVYIPQKSIKRICKLIREETGWKTKPGRKS